MGVMCICGVVSDHGTPFQVQGEGGQTSWGRGEFVCQNCLLNLKLFIEFKNGGRMLMSGVGGGAPFPSSVG